MKSNHSKIQPAKVIIYFIKSIKSLFKEPGLEHCSTKYIFPSLWLLSFLPSLLLLPLSLSHPFAFSLHVFSELVWVLSLHNSVLTRVCPLCSPGWRCPHGSLAKVTVVPLWPLAFLWHCSNYPHRAFVFTFGYVTFFLSFRHSFLKYWHFKYKRKLAHHGMPKILCLRVKRENGEFEASLCCGVGG